MRLLQINCWYDKGSTGKIVQSIQKYAIKHGHEVYVAYGMGKKSKSPYAFRVTSWIVRKVQSFCTRITGYPYGDCLWGTFNIIRFIKKINPDIVHIQCINGYMVNIYKVLEFLKINDIPTVITNHAEFMYTGGCVHAVECTQWKSGCHHCNKIGKEHPKSYFFDRTEKEWKLMRAAYKGFKYLYICNVSDWLSDRARQSPFYEHFNVKTVMNGLDTNIFHYQMSDKYKLKNQYCQDGKKIVIHVTPSFDNPIKGGKHVVKMAKKFPDVDFLVVGDVQKKCQYPENLKLIGHVENQNLLAAFYALGDVCLLTSLRETFSMVTAESLACGTPVVGFKAGGPETIALPAYSSFVEQGDDEKLGKQLYNMLSKKYDKRQISMEAVKTYSDQIMCRNYFQIYEELLSTSRSKHFCR
jgi:putative colanic acid biosynthesis glycosyltransferase